MGDKVLTEAHAAQVLDYDQRLSEEVIWKLLVKLYTTCENDGKLVMVLPMLRGAMLAIMTGKPPAGMPPGLAGMFGGLLPTGRNGG